MTTYDVLRKARAYLLEHGWKQGGYGDHGGPRCMLGAVRSVDDSQGDFHPAVKVLEGYLCVDDCLLHEWNDADGRTLDDVIAAMDKAILATAPPLDDTPIFQALESLPAEDYIEALSVLALIPEGELA